jgi:hypothetical protein
MPFKQERFRIAVLDDYQNVALSLADWSVLDGRAMVTVFNDHLADPAKGGNPALDTFEIDRDSCGPMVLDALVKINDQIDPILH